jgi:hypothetical protein
MERGTNMDRQEVYKAIDSEREYQDSKWKGSPHTLTEWLVFIEDYTAEAKHLLSRNWDAEVATQASDIMRKIAGMAVAALEEHGVRER